MNKVVSICNTPMQIINTVNLALNEFPDEKFDIIVSDQFSNSEALINSLKTCGCFNNVYYIIDRKFTLQHGLRSFFPLFLRKRWVKKIKKMNADLAFDYNILLFNNLDSFSNLFALSQNKLTKIIWFEEGASSYCVQGSYWIFKKNILKSTIKNILNLNFIQRNITDQYLYKPELANYKVPFKRHVLKPLTYNNEKMKLVLNKIFLFSDDEILKKKFIFFEESYRIDGYKINDLEIIENIIKLIGKDNLIVKVHPRSNSNDLKMQCIINNNTTIPWELYCLNMKSEEKVLISISSGCLLSQYLYFSQKYKAISLINFLDTSKLPEDKRLYLDFIYEKIYMKNKDIFYTPHDINELRNLL